MLTQPSQQLMRALTTLTFLSVTIIAFSQEAVCSFDLPDSILFEDIKDIKMINDVNQIPSIKILDTLQNSFGTIILFVTDNYDSYYIAMKKKRLGNILTFLMLEESKF